MVTITIDLPDDLYEIAMSMARESDQTLSEVVVALMRRALSLGEYE